jgi:hypothetical protein
MGANSKNVSHSTPNHAEVCPTLGLTFPTSWKTRCCKAILPGGIPSRITQR